MKSLHERRRRSARETFAACRARYKAEYLDGVDMSNEFTRRGNAFAAAKSRYLSDLWAERLSDDADMAQEALTWARVNTPGITHEEWLDLETLWAKFAPDYRLDLDRFYSVEGEQPCFDTVLRYDEVEVTNPDTLTIIDDKTFWRIPPTTALEHSYQVAFYLAGARRVFPGFQHYRFVFRFVRYGVLSDPIELDAAELDLIEQAIKESDAAMAQAEDSGFFPATSGAKCSTCMIARSGCPLVMDALGRQTWRSDYVNVHVPTGNLDQLLEELAALQQATSQALDLVREAAKERGYLSHGGIVWAHRPKTATVYPAAQIIELLEANDLPRYGLTFSATSVKPLMTKRFAAVRDQISALAVVKSHGTVFSGKPTQGTDDAEQAPETE